MIKKTGLVLMSALHGALVWGASDGGAQGLPKFPDPLHFVLERLVNPMQSILGGGGTHNLIHYACLDDKRAVAGFLPSSPRTQLEKTIGTHISDDRNEPAHTFSVGKARFALFHEQGARHLVLREYAKGCIDQFEDREIAVDGLQDPAYGECLIVLSIAHGALFKCWSAQAGVGKTLRVDSPSMPRTVHLPPEALREGYQGSPVQRSVHTPSCLCSDCMQLLQAVPSYPAPSCPPALPFRVMQSSSNPYQK